MERSVKYQHHSPLLSFKSATSGQWRMRAGFCECRLQLFDLGGNAFVFRSQLERETPSGTMAPTRRSHLPILRMSFGSTSMPSFWVEESSCPRCDSSKTWDRTESQCI